MTVASTTALCFAVAIVAGVAYVRAGRRLDPPVWAWFVDELRRHTRTGAVAVPVALIGVARHGPLPLRRAAAAAQRSRISSGGQIAAITAFAAALDDPLARRLCAALRGAVVLDVDPVALLDDFHTMVVDRATTPRASERRLRSTDIAIRGRHAHGLRTSGRRDSTRLTARLQGHVPHEFDATTFAWWRPADAVASSALRGLLEVPVARWRERRASVALAYVAEQVGLLHAAGATIAAAVSFVAADVDGVTGRALHVVTAQMAAGQVPAMAFRAWAAHWHSPGVASIAAALDHGRADGDTAARLLATARHLRRREAAGADRGGVRSVSS